MSKAASWSGFDRFIAITATQEEVALEPYFETDDEGHILWHPSRNRRFPDRDYPIVATDRYLKKLHQDGKNGTTRVFRLDIKPPPT